MTSDLKKQFKNALKTPMCPYPRLFLNVCVLEANWAARQMQPPQKTDWMEDLHEALHNN